MLETDAIRVPLVLTPAYVFEVREGIVVLVAVPMIDFDSSDPWTQKRGCYE